MATRRPLKLIQEADSISGDTYTADSAGGTGNPHYQLQEMTDAEIETLQYLALVGWASGMNATGTNLDTYISFNSNNNATSIDVMTDTRLKAGVTASGVSNFPPENVTDEPTLVSTQYKRMNLVQNTTASRSGGYTMPGQFVWYDGGQSALTQFSDTDFFDTFIDPALDLLVNGTTWKGLFELTTSTVNDANWALISATPIYSDTTANLSAYTSTSIPAAGIAQDSFTQTDYYLRARKTETSTQSTKTNNIVRPVMSRLTTSGSQLQGDLFQPTENQVIEHMRNIMWDSSWATTGNVGNRIAYQINQPAPSGILGTGCPNTVLQGGSGNYTQSTNFNSGDDYRAAEFPDGTLVTASTYYLRIYRY